MILNGVKEKFYFCQRRETRLFLLKIKVYDPKPHGKFIFAKGVKF